MAESNETSNILSYLTKSGAENDKVMEIYSRWATTYDKEIMAKDLGYKSPASAAAVCADLLKHNPQAKILDLAAGTGLVGEELQKRGFLNLDALDGSQEMLERAKTKNIYGQLICDLLGPNRLDIEDDTYNCCVTVGSFVPGHVDHTSFPEIIRITKPEGYFVLSMRESYLTECSEFENLEPTMKKLEEEGKWTIVSRTRVDEYALGKSGIIFIFKILNH